MNSARNFDRQEDCGKIQNLGREMENCVTVQGILVAIGACG